MTSTLEFPEGDGSDCIVCSGASARGDSGSETKVAKLEAPSVLLEKTQLSSPFGDRCQVASPFSPSEKGPTESVSVPELFLNSMTSPPLSSHCEFLPTIA